MKVLLVAGSAGFTETVAPGLMTMPPGTIVTGSVNSIVRDALLALRGTPMSASELEIFGAVVSSQVGVSSVEPFPSA